MAQNFEGAIPDRVVEGSLKTYPENFTDSCLSYTPGESNMEFAPSLYGASAPLESGIPSGYGGATFGLDTELLNTAKASGTNTHLVNAHPDVDLLATFTAAVQSPDAGTDGLLASPELAIAAQDNCTTITATADLLTGMDSQTGLVQSTQTKEDEYLVGDWDGDGRDNIAVRRGNLILMDTNFDGIHDIEQTFGRGNDEDQYLVGDWDGDGRDNIAVRRDNRILMDTNFDGIHDIEQTFGRGSEEDQYLVGDWYAAGRDHIAVRRGNQLLADVNFDGVHEFQESFGRGKEEDEYFAGDWNGDGFENFAVRRGNRILMDFDFGGGHDLEQVFGAGKEEDDYLIGDWDGDGLDNIAVRRGNRILMDTNFDGTHDFEQTFGRG